MIYFRILVPFEVEVFFKKLQPRTLFGNAFLDAERRTVSFSFPSRLKFFEENFNLERCLGMPSSNPVCLPFFVTNAKNAII